MRKKTKELLEESWLWLRMNPDLNGFSNQAEFEAEWDELEEVAGDGSSSYFTRVDEEKLFESGNVAVINIKSAKDWETVLSPAIGGGYPYE